MITYSKQAQKYLKSTCGKDKTRLTKTIEALSPN